MFVIKNLAEALGKLPKLPHSLPQTLNNTTRSDYFMKSLWNHHRGVEVKLKLDGASRSQL